MSENKFREWQAACIRALLEPLGSPTLPERVKEAETAINVGFKNWGRALMEMRNDKASMTGCAACDT
jgi:hypothetical protein